MATHRRSPVSSESLDPHVCTPDVRRQVLAHVPFFSQLTHDQIHDIDQRCRVEDFAVGEAVHHAGQTARRLWVVATGTAKLVRPTADGTEVLLDVLRPGDFFGALPVLGTQTYPDSVWPLTPLCVLSLDTETFDGILDTYPSVARAGLTVMAGRLDQAQRHIHRIASATAEQRIAGVLSALAERAGTRRRGTTLIDVPLSRDDLAGMTASASETVSRVLAKLQRDDVIDAGRRWVAVRDLDRLQALATV